MWGMNAHNQKIGKPNNLKVLEKKRTNVHKQDRHDRLGSHIPEEGEP